MDTQNTPIHVKLWHREFWLMALADMLLTMSVYMLIPVLPQYMFFSDFSPLETASAMGIYGIGVFAFGGFCSYLVQRYRRNNVCSWSILGMVLTLVGMYYLFILPAGKVEFWMILVERFFMGAFFGLAQMVLSSTLIIDTCESFQRTQANHAAAWFSRFALSLGPLYGMGVSILLGREYAILAAGICALLSLVLIRLIKFPFRSPEETVKIFSSDRFFLPQGLPLFVNLVFITIIMGLALSMYHTGMFYCMLMFGFVLSLMAERYVFLNADLKSEVVTGLIMMFTAFLLMMTRHEHVLNYIVPSMLGFGVGIIGSRFLLFFIKLANHCQRGTSQSTFFLAWEFGISTGLALGLSRYNESAVGLVKTGEYVKNYDVLICGMVLAVICLVIYNFAVHPWYMKHKNR